MRRSTGALVAVCFLSSTLISCSTAGLIADHESIKLQYQRDSKTKIIPKND